MGNPVILTPEGKTAKTGNQANCRSAVKLIQTMRYMYIMQYFSTTKKVGNNAKAGTGKKVEMIIPCEVRDTERDKYQYHMISPLGVI